MIVDIRLSFSHPLGSNSHPEKQNEEKTGNSKNLNPLPNKFPFPPMHTRLDIRDLQIDLFNTIGSESTRVSSLLRSQSFSSSTHTLTHTHILRVAFGTTINLTFRGSNEIKRSS